MRARAFWLSGAFWSEGEEKLGAQPFVFPHRFPPHSYWLLPLPWEGDGQASWTEGSKEPSAANVDSRITAIILSLAFLVRLARHVMYSCVILSRLSAEPFSPSVFCTVQMLE